MARVLISILGVAALLGAIAASGDTGKAASREKYVIILQAGKETHEGMARALHALLYARELKEHGHAIVLVFDGAGTEWAEEWTKPDSTHPLAPAYRKLRDAGVTEVVCDYCSGAFQVKGKLRERGVPLTAEFDGHPSVARWVDEGYRLLVL
ncbi:MAG: DsrE family protein [Candidatus Binatia bacterium]